ncbi:MAG TPA: Crp/Fnr family transcriptional regulator [Burkholderiales bacterium]|nr:Crp/Fnr family transcriptional regulator [Burkholderiales bacterium]
MLPQGEYERLLPMLERVALRSGEVLVEPHKKSRYVYFPVDGTLSLYYPMDHGLSSEIALIGNDGMLSIATVLGGRTLPYLAIVESDGQAYRLEEKVLRQELQRSANLVHILLLYAQALFIQMAQISVCGRQHSLRQQLCLHLLLMHDRMLSDEFRLTQQAIAHMLGVRRESVTKASGELRDAGIIGYRRGYITVHDRPGLEGQCCECYGMLQLEFGRLLG